MIKEAIGQLVEGKDLSYETALAVMEEIMSGEVSNTLISGYLVALRMKGETTDEITASAVGMRNKGIKLEHDYDVIEIVGTGGDKSFSFNISTTSAIVASAAGVKVAKHGNKGVSSKSGAADVLSALGANIMAEPQVSKKLLDEIGFCFLFAQKYHSSMKYVGPVRGELGIRTVFNVLGPLTNPAAANLQVLGVYDESLMRPLAEVLTKLGVKRGLVVFGEDVMDEITVSAPTKICEFGGGEYKDYVITPEEFCFKRCLKSDLVGGDAQENAEITKAILNGQKGPKRDAVLLNAGAAIYVYRNDVTLKEAVRIAEETIDSKKAAAQLEKYIELSNE